MKGRLTEAEASLASVLSRQQVLFGRTSGQTSGQSSGQSLGQSLGQSSGALPEEEATDATALVQEELALVYQAKGALSPDPQPDPNPNPDPDPYPDPNPIPNPNPTLTPT